MLSVILGAAKLRGSKGEAGLFLHATLDTRKFSEARHRCKLRIRGTFGALAQLGEHLLCKQGVTGSIPVRSILQGHRSVASNCARPSRFPAAHQEPRGDLLQGR